MTYRGLPADFDAWKTRSDRDDWWNEPETEGDMEQPADIAALVERLRTGVKLTGEDCMKAAAALEACQAEIGRLQKDIEGYRARVWGKS